jgi:leucyl-tRNA synthetase family protein
MFPYPSGALHMGHVRVYTIADVIARQRAMRGCRTINPIGWDAFGLPAENAALERTVEPSDWTLANVEQMRGQLRSLGFAFSWEREVATCQPSYYRWTQWIFTELMRHGLAYRAEAEVNWDPVDCTVLADEQVDEHGRSWRSGTRVERRVLMQWFLRITKYADELYTSLDALDWPDNVKEMQRHWIRGSEKNPRHMHDWLISRQRYWGTPIPAVHCVTCGTLPVPAEDLPVMLPLNMPQRQPGAGSDAAPLAADPHWRHCKCPKCGGAAERETDTMDTFVDSAWYFLRYADPTLQTRAFPADVSRILPVDVYVGGIEHAILHLLYARFITKFLRDAGHAPGIHEPFKRLITQGMVQGRTFKDPATGRFLRPQELERDPNSPSGMRVVGTGTVPTVSWEKMSKSKHNGVDPNAMVAKYGADTVRLFVLFKAPPDIVLEWDEEHVVGVMRWLNRLWALYSWHIGERARSEGSAVTSASIPTGGPWSRTLHTALQKCVDAVNGVFALKPNTMPAFNVAIARMMELSNVLREIAEAHPEAARARDFNESLDVLVRLLTPFAPHFTSEVSARMGAQVAQEQWPAECPPLAVAASVEAVVVAVHVRGKFCTQISVLPSVLDDSEQLRVTVGGLVAVQERLGGQVPSRYFVAPNRKMVNVV